MLHVASLTSKEPTSFINNTNYGKNSK